MKPTKGLKDVTIYTDGGCQLNLGPGGYSVVLLYNGRRKELSGGYRYTTNNRMELMAAIAGLLALNTKCNVTLYSDSAYLVSQMIGRLPERWAKNGWKNSSKQPVQNRDLWEKLVAACARHQVRFLRVPGHGVYVESWNNDCGGGRHEALMCPCLRRDSGDEHVVQRHHTLKRGWCH